MLESKLWYNKTEMVEFIKTCANTLENLILVIFSAPLSSSLSGEEKYKKRCLGEMGNFLLPGLLMIRTWGRFLLRDISKNEQIQLIESQIFQ